ncbi:MAG TPA: hypothetical protein VE007_12615 [Thermoanaerobaculia bacterium]|nr:hypothetical protein [Thermoanaerobaculia bacterium]
MPESLRCPVTGRTWNMRVPDDKRLEQIHCEACGNTHSMAELLGVAKNDRAPLARR